MRSLVVLAVVLVVSVVADPPDPCTIPNQFMSGMSTTVFDVNECASASTQGLLYFDYPNQQLRVDETASIGGNTYTLTVWLDYNNEMGYYYDRDNNVCYSKDIVGSLEDPQLPDDSDYLNTVLIGSQAVDNWVTPENDDTGMYSYVSLAEGSCWPIMDVHLNNTNDVPVVTENFYDFIPQLPPFYFDMPESCMSSKKVAEVPKTVLPRLFHSWA